MYKVNKRLIARGIEEILKERLNRIERLIRYDEISDERKIIEAIAKYDATENIAIEIGVNTEEYNQRRNVLARISDAFFSVEI